MARAAKRGWGVTATETGTCRVEVDTGNDGATGTCMVAVAGSDFVAEVDVVAP